MTSGDAQDAPESTAGAEERQRKRDVKRAITFGVIMATLQMGALLWFVWC